MRLKTTYTNDTTVLLQITADEAELATYKTKTLNHLKGSVKMAGFRGGKAPLELIEKSLDQTVLQNEFIEEALTSLYTAAAKSEKLRPIASPNVTIKKFVPFTTLEFDAEVTVVGQITLADYKKIKATRQPVKVTKKEIDDVIENLRTRGAVKNDVTRASKDGDQVWIDFDGYDAKGQPIERADGKEYPLLLGSGTFIPGFEPELVGKKSGDKTEFTLNFPKDYGVKNLQGKKVTFKVTVNKVQEVVKPEVNDEFATTLGPFKNLGQLHDDIEKQLHSDKYEASRRDFEASIIKQIVEKSKLAVPDALVTEQVEMLVQEVRQNAIYRGQTFEELLKLEGKTEEEYKNDTLKAEALDRVKAGLVLNEIAMQEKITVETEELDERINALKAQYNDDKMRTELDKTENQREIATRILTEKTIKLLTELAEN